MLEGNLKQFCQLECDNPCVGVKDMFFITCQSSKNKWKYINFNKAHPNEFCQEGYQAAIMRSRAEKYVLGEQPTRRDLRGKHKCAFAKEIQCILSAPLLSFDKDVTEDVFVRHSVSRFGCNRTPFSLALLHNMSSNINVLPKRHRICIESLTQ